MCQFEIADLDLDVSLTELEVNSIIGGFSSRHRPNSRKQRHGGFGDTFKDVFQFQSNIATVQGNANVGSKGKQKNDSNVNIFFL